MTPLSDLTKARPGISEKAAHDLMEKYKKKVLPLLQDDGTIAGSPRSGS